MAGFLKRLLGGKDKHGANVAGGTKKVDKPVVTGKHVQTFKSLKSSKAQGSPRQEGDTGPWYIGKTVADIFEIRGVLGRGGMGIVYQAHDKATQRKVAVKVPLGKFVDDEDAKKRFTREAEAWTGLIHPHIVHAFDVRDEQSTDYRPAIFMDYCDGGSLSDRICNGQRLSMTKALDVAIQVCWAMEFAHKKGHIHRDLKPANVLLTSDGEALVTDFGLVKMLDAEDLELDSSKLSEADAEVLASISQAGGTPEYMPPEQWVGKAEKASDIYAFGVMLYELFCGCRPFTAENRFALRVPHMQVPPPDPRQFNGRIPDGQAELMLSCLAKRPSARPTSFGDLADRLVKAYVAAPKQERLAAGYSRPKPEARTISDADKESRAWALIRLGNGCQLRGDLLDATRHFGKSQVLFEELSNKAGIGKCYGNMGNVFQSRGNYDKAIALYEKSLAISKDLGDKVDIGSCYTNMGLVEQYRGNYDKAMALYEKSLAISKELGDKAGMGRCYGNIATVAQYCGDYDKAMALYEKSLAISKDLADKAGMGNCYIGMGVVAQSRSNDDEAMALHKKSLAIRKDLGDKVGMRICYKNMTVLAQITCDNHKMRVYAREAVILSDQLDIPIDEVFRKAAGM